MSRVNIVNRFSGFFRDRSSIGALSGDDLMRFVVTLKKDHGLGSNTILHNAVIVALFLKRNGRSGITKRCRYQVSIGSAERSKKRGAEVGSRRRKRCPRTR